MLIAGAGVGGLALASVLDDVPTIKVTVLEQTDEFKRFGGPIQLASNALQILKEMDESIFEQVQAKFTVTGDKQNGIKDGIRNEWYSTFDLASPAESRGMPYSGVIDRPDLQNILLQSVSPGVVQNGDGVAKYEQLSSGVTAHMESGNTIKGDVLIGADGIWSRVRQTMRQQPAARGKGSGAVYSGYTVFVSAMDRLPRCNTNEHSSAGWRAGLPGS